MSKRKILLVEDKETSLKLLKAVYEQDYEVLTARDGLEALEILFQHTVDLVISDVLMPNMDGYYLTYKIRNNPRLRDIPVIMYTATYVSMSEENIAKEMGASMYLRKPAPVKILLSVVEEILADPGKYPYTIPTRPEAAERMGQYSTKLITRLEQNNIELDEANERLRQLSAHLQITREEERKYLAREIHDQLGQMLTGLRMDIVWLKKKIESTDEAVVERFKKALGLLNDTKEAMRRISNDLHPALLGDLGLVAALELHGREFENRCGIKINFSASLDELNEMELGQDMTIGLFRVFQESLNNITKHAEAKEVNTLLKKENGNLVMSVHDNGKGFNVSEIKQKKTLGLISMQERALMMGGKCEIQSIPCEGTTVSLTVPIQLK